MSVAELSLVEPPVGWIMGEGYQYGVDILEPFEGYWVKNISTPARTVMLQILPREAVKKTEKEIPGVRDGWRLEISAFCGANSDRGNTLGMISDAADAWDGNDRSEPPMSPGQGMSVYFPHGEWNQRPGIYTVDIRGDEDDADRRHGHLWHFDVAKNYTDNGPADEVLLEFTGLEEMPKEVEVLLLDLRLAQTVDLREEADYRFFLGEKKHVTRQDEARFALLVGNKTLIDQELADLSPLPSRTALHQNFPNPFNPSTVIRYDVAQAGPVSVRIYNLAGAMVKTVFSGHAEPGGYEFVWPGVDEHGRRVASGVYFFRLEAGSFAETKRMMLVK